MNWLFLNELLLALIAFMGLPLGSFIASRTQEELQTGRKYFPWLERITLLAIIAILLSLYGAPLWLRFVLYAIAIALLLFFEPPSISLYTLLAIALFFSRGTSLYWTGSMIFLYGLACGSMQFAEQKSKPLSLLLTHSSFLVAILVLYLWQPF